MQTPDDLRIALIVLGNHKLGRDCDILPMNSLECLDSFISVLEIVLFGQVYSQSDDLCVYSLVVTSIAHVRDQTSQI